MCTNLSLYWLRHYPKWSLMCCHAILHTLGVERRERKEAERISYGSYFLHSLSIGNIVLHLFFFFSCLRCVTSWHTIAIERPAIESGMRVRMRCVCMCVCAPILLCIYLFTYDGSNSCHLARCTGCCSYSEFGRRWYWFDSAVWR